MASGNIGNSLNLMAGMFVDYSNQEGEIAVLLGSCVSVIMHVPSRFTLVCHSLLPQPYILENDKTCQLYEIGSCALCKVDSFKYVSCTLKHMLDVLKSRNVSTTMVEVSILGGSSVLGGNDGSGIGTSNYEMALTLLKRFGFLIKHVDVGGKDGRMIRFVPKSNKLYVRMLNSGDEFELRGKKHIAYKSSNPYSLEDQIRLLNIEIERFNSLFGSKE